MTEFSSYANRADPESNPFTRTGAPNIARKQLSGDLGGGTGEAFSISADGQVIVGRSTTGGTGERAFRWTAATGMRNLTTMYSGGVGSGSYLQYANAVSGDGVHVVGYGYNRSRNRYEAYCTH